VLEVGALPLDYQRENAHADELERQQKPVDAERRDQRRGNRQHTEQPPAARRTKPRPPIGSGEHGFAGEKCCEPEPENIAAVEISPQCHQRHEPHRRHLLLAAGGDERGHPPNEDR
jgi:hypothetical protein